MDTVDEEKSVVGLFAYKAGGSRGLWRGAATGCSVQTANIPQANSYGIKTFDGVEFNPDVPKTYFDGLEL